MEFDLLAAIEVETHRLESDRNDAVVTLRLLEEAYARQLLGLEPEVQGEPVLARDLEERVQRGLELRTAMVALTHLLAAEGWQWEIGSWSTGAGEGFASMGKIYGLKLGQAWLHAALGAPERAHKLVSEVELCPNKLGRFWSKEIARLRARLGRAQE
jgi:hypothetical protein